MFGGLEALEAFKTLGMSWSSLFESGWTPLPLMIGDLRWLPFGWVE